VAALMQGVFVSVNCGVTLVLVPAFYTRGHVPAPTRPTFYTCPVHGYSDPAPVPKMRSQRLCYRHLPSCHTYDMVPPYEVVMTSEQTDK